MVQSTAEHMWAILVLGIGLPYPQVGGGNSLFLSRNGHTFVREFCIVNMLHPALGYRLYAKPGKVRRVSCTFPEWACTYIAEFATLTLRVHTLSHRVHIPLITAPRIGMKENGVFRVGGLLNENSYSLIPWLYWSNYLRSVEYIDRRTPHTASWSV